MSHTICKEHLKDLQRLNRANYHLLLRLVPELDIIPGRASSHVVNDIDLELTILERSRFTTTLSLTHYIPVGETWVSAPDLWIRVYHDARVAEAIPRADGSSLVAEKLDTWNHALDPQQKWQLNDFMEKWLHRCLRKGHRIDCDETILI